MVSAVEGHKMHASRADLDMCATQVHVDGERHREHAHYPRLHGELPAAGFGPDEAHPSRREKSWHVRRARI